MRLNLKDIEQIKNLIEDHLRVLMLAFTQDEISAFLNKIFNDDSFTFANIPLSEKSNSTELYQSIFKIINYYHFVGDEALSIEHLGIQITDHHEWKIQFQTLVQSLIVASYAVREEMQPIKDYYEQLKEHNAALQSEIAHLKEKLAAFEPESCEQSSSAIITTLLSSAATPAQEKLKVNGLVAIYKVIDSELDFEDLRLEFANKELADSFTTYLNSQPSKFHFKIVRAFCFDYSNRSKPIEIDLHVRKLKLINNTPEYNRYSESPQIEGELLLQMLEKFFDITEIPLEFRHNNHNPVAIGLIYIQPMMDTVRLVFKSNEEAQNFKKMWNRYAKQKKKVWVVYSITDPSNILELNINYANASPHLKLHLQQTRPGAILLQQLIEDSIINPDTPREEHDYSDKMEAWQETHTYQQHSM